jgi:hypothetical protein
MDGDVGSLSPSDQAGDDGDEDALHEDLRGAAEASTEGA